MAERRLCFKEFETKVTNQELDYDAAIMAVKRQIKRDCTTEDFILMVELLLSLRQSKSAEVTNLDVIQDMGEKFVERNDYDAALRMFSLLSSNDMSPTLLQLKLKLFYLTNNPELPTIVEDLKKIKQEDGVQWLPFTSAIIGTLFLDDKNFDKGIGVFIEGIKLAEAANDSVSVRTLQILVNDAALRKAGGGMVSNAAAAIMRKAPYDYGESKKADSMAAQPQATTLEQRKRRTQRNRRKEIPKETAKGAGEGPEGEADSECLKADNECLKADGKKRKSKTRKQKGNKGAGKGPEEEKVNVGDDADKGEGGQEDVIAANEDQLAKRVKDLCCNEELQKAGSGSLKAGSECLKADTEKRKRQTGKKRGKHGISKETAEGDVKGEGREKQEWNTEKKIEVDEEVKQEGQLENMFEDLCCDAELLKASSESLKADSECLKADTEERKRQTEKKKGKPIPKETAVGAVKGEGREEQEWNTQKKIEEDVEVKQEVRNDEKKPKRVNFVIPITFSGEKLPGAECYDIFVETNATKIRKTAIKGQTCHRVRCQDLVDLCSQNVNLVTVEQGFIDLDGDYCLQTEVVMTVQKYLQLKLEVLKSTCIEDWWRDTQDFFLTITRDIVNGLMFLFDKNMSCGNVLFNVFVTEGGRGKLLPSMDVPSKTKIRQDLLELGKLLKEIIRFPFPEHEDLDTFLPPDLNSFRLFLGDANSRWDRIPVLFLVHHPYLWTADEKKRFALKMRDLLKKPSKRSTMEHKINTELQSLTLFTGWENVPKGVYFHVLDYPNRTWGRRYHERFQIAVFVNAVFTHVNDTGYQNYRKNKERIEVEDIVKDLECFFPNYYIGMFECVCSCRQKGIIESDADLFELSVYTKPK